VNSATRNGRYEPLAAAGQNSTIPLPKSRAP
jgi:hypothetical protein